MNSCISHLVDQDIEIADNFLPGKLFRRLSDFMQGPIWKYGHYSNLNNDRFCFWSASFIDNRKNNFAHHLTNTTEVPDAVNEVLNLLLNTVLAGHIVERAYANSHTFGVEGGIHRDSDDVSSKTTIIYCHPNWKTSWGGELEIYDTNIGEIIQSIVPKPNRLVSFPGPIPHCARSLSRDCAELRISLVIKTKNCEGSE